MSSFLPVTDEGAASGKHLLLPSSFHRSSGRALSQSSRNTLSTVERKRSSASTTQLMEGKTTIYSKSRQGVILPREIVSWLHLLRLPHKIKLPKRDLSNGYLIAHICSFYWPGVNLNGFYNGLSKSIKRENWELLHKEFKRNGVPLNRKVMEGMIQSKDGYAESFLRQLYTLLTGKEIKEGKPLRLPLVEAEIYNPGALAQQMKSTLEAYRDLTTEENHRRRGLSTTDRNGGTSSEEISLGVGPGGGGGLTSSPPLHKLDPASSHMVLGAGRSTYFGALADGVKPIRTYQSLENGRNWSGNASHKELRDDCNTLHGSAPKEGFSVENSNEMEIDERTGFEFTIEVRPSHCTSTVVQVPSCSSPVQHDDNARKMTKTGLSAGAITGDAMRSASLEYDSGKNEGRARRGTLEPLGMNLSLKSGFVKEWAESIIKAFADEGWRLHAVDCPTYTQFLLQHEEDIDGATQGSIWNHLISQIGYLVELIKNQSEALKDLLELMLVTPEALRSLKGGDGGTSEGERTHSMSFPSTAMQPFQCGGNSLSSEALQDVPRQGQANLVNGGTGNSTPRKDTLECGGNAFLSDRLPPPSPSSGGGGFRGSTTGRNSLARRSNTPVVTSPRVFMFLAATLSHLTELDPYYALSAFSAALLSFPTIQWVLRHLNTHLADMYGSLFCALISLDAETAGTLLPDLLSAIYECITQTDSTPTAKMSYLILLQSMIRRLAQRGAFTSLGRPSPPPPQQQQQPRGGRGGTRPTLLSSPRKGLSSPNRIGTPSSSLGEGRGKKKEGDCSLGSACERRREENDHRVGITRTSSPLSITGSERKRPTRDGSAPYSVGEAGEGRIEGGGVDTGEENMANGRGKGAGQSSSQCLAEGLHAIATMHAVMALSSEYGRLRMVGASLIATLAQTGYPPYDSFRHFRNVLFPSFPSSLFFCSPRQSSASGSLMVLPSFSNMGFSLSPLEVVLRAIWLQVTVEQVCRRDPGVGTALCKTDNRQSFADVPIRGKASSSTTSITLTKLQEGEHRNRSASSVRPSSAGGPREGGEGSGGRVGVVLDIPLPPNDSPGGGMLDEYKSTNGSDTWGGNVLTSHDLIRDLLPLFQQMSAYLMQSGGHRKSKGLVAFQLALSLPFLPLTRFAIKPPGTAGPAGGGPVLGRGPAPPPVFTPSKIIPPAGPGTLLTHTMPSIPIADEIASAVMTFFVKNCSSDLVTFLVAPPTEQSYSAITRPASGIGGSGGNSSCSSSNDRGKRVGGGSVGENGQSHAKKNAGGNGDNAGFLLPRTPSSVSANTHSSILPASRFSAGRGGEGGMTGFHGRNTILVDPLLGAFGVENMLCRTCSVLLCRALYKTVLPYTGDVKDAVRRLGVRAANIARERYVPPDVRSRLEWLFWINVWGRGFHPFPEETTFISRQEMIERWREILFDCYDDIAVVTSAGTTLTSQQQRLHTDEQMHSLIALSNSARRVVFRWYTELSSSVSPFSESTGSNRPSSRSRSGGTRRSSARMRGEADEEDSQKRRKLILVDPVGMLDEPPEKLDQAMEWYHTNFNSNIRQEGTF